jgi:flagellar assembly protein FliH
MTASRFLFDRDFRNPGGAAVNLAAVKEAEERAFAQGVAEGRRQAAAEAEAQLAAAMRRVAETGGALLAAVDVHQARCEEEALAFGAALGRKLAGAALDAYPLDAITETARASFHHLRGVPHLVVRVNERLVDTVQARLQPLTREAGYEGRLVVIGDPDIAPADGRIEWADGGLVREQARIVAAVDQILAGAHAGPQS